MFYKSLFYFYIIIIFVFSLLPFYGYETRQGNNYILSTRSDYIIHVVMFLPFLLVFRLSYRFNMFAGIALAILYAMLTELVQIAVPYRTFNINDLVANVFGVIIGLFPALIINKIQQRTR